MLLNGACVSATEAAEPLELPWQDNTSLEKVCEPVKE